jgi:tetratricopeptide (TPR) repeat protein
LQHYRPDTAPLDYAMTQNNRANRLSEIAGLPGEDRRERLLAALAAYDEALRYRRPDTAPLDYAMTQGNLSNWHRAFLQLPGEDACLHRLQALRSAFTAFTLFQRLGHVPYATQAARQVSEIGVEAGPLFTELWAELKVGEPPEWLTAQLALTRLPEGVRQALADFVQTRQQAESENSEADWRAAALAGQSLLDSPEADQLPFDLSQLRAEVAGCWNTLGNVLSEQSRHAEALAAYDAAIQLQPEFAMWHRNRVGTLTELKRFDEAEAALTRATELEPGHERLAELRKELDAARTNS